MAYAEHTEDGFVGRFEEGTGWFCYPTKRFKTVTLQAFWINDLTAEHAAEGALLPHVLRRGTQRWPSLMAIEQKLEDLYGASFRADVGKVADKQLLSMHLEVVHGQYLPGNPDTVQQALDFLREASQNPRLGPHGFDAEVVAQEKILLERQIQSLVNDKSQYAMSRLIEIMADGRPFGLRKLGTIPDVERITSESLFNYYQTLRRNSPTMILVVGDVDPQRIEQYVQESNSGPRPGISAITLFEPHHVEQEVIEQQPIRQGKVNLGYGTGMAAGSPQYPALMMYAGVLGGFPHSKLFVNVREKHSLAYYAYARLDAALGLMVIGAGIEFSHYQAVRQIVNEQLEAMAAGQISEQEMAFTLKAFYNDILSEEDTPGQLIGRQLERVLMGGGLNGRQLMDALGRVSIQDIQHVSEHIALDTAYFLTAINPEEARHGKS